jgi:hypothetical protein
MQGSMTIQRSKMRTVALGLAGSLAVALAAPLAAQAGPLLSGYGGPGQGNQAILGSTLIGGPGGGSGGSGGGPEAGTTASAPGTPRANGLKSGAGTTHATSARGSSGRGAHGASAAGSAAQASGGELSERSYRGFESAGGSSALGLSAGEIVYIVLAAAALAFTGLLTRRLAGTRTAKGNS